LPDSVADLPKSGTSCWIDKGLDPPRKASLRESSNNLLGLNPIITWGLTFECDVERRTRVAMFIHISLDGQDIGRFYLRG